MVFPLGSATVPRTLVNTRRVVRRRSLRWHRITHLNRHRAAGLTDQQEAAKRRLGATTTPFLGENP